MQMLVNLYLSTVFIPVAHHIVSVFFLHSSKVYHYSTIVLAVFTFLSLLCSQAARPTRNFGQMKMDGNHNVFYLKSPGTDSHYPSKRLSYYHIKCNDGSRFEIKFFHLNRFSLQDKVRTSYNQRKCVDYVKITDLNNPNKNEEFCGTLKAHSGSRLGTNTYSNNVLVTFRSSKYNNNYQRVLDPSKMLGKISFNGELLESRRSREFRVCSWTDC